MGNYKLVFGGSKPSETEDFELTCYVNFRNNIYIAIDNGDYPPSFICLDKQTAIKFHRELKKQISFIRDEEVDNG